ncbi:thioredoxin domain-containing protein [Luteipulveratus sp. YIM 133132]|uniref:Thioredoxin domain-containing protein n=1 Tax=Luteipulveratus flavus TaxID=3031728 RepID=A0ABT6C5F1_9MICO|nr:MULTISPECIES: thioredoxin domain-containing protein [unclassified Luteipulveratus]MDE9366010.1 thioredoxin domain-containing protein [Luteipulveratus sp. YIM 133132]MDF8264112.1 thioredoxin domain-containing protein [Luteipulveratus sp. YIM 133296]
MPRPDASAKLAATAPRSGPPKALIAAVIAVVVVIVAGAVFFITSNPFGKLDAAGPKASQSEGNGVVVHPGRAKAGAPTVEVYEDFQCPVCKKMETTNGASIRQLAASGDIKLVSHMMSFLDDNLGNDWSKKSANAAFCAADAGKFPEYHDAVFAGQPAQEGQGYTDQQLKQTFAAGAGITGSALSTFTRCVDQGTYDDYVTDTEKRSNDDGVNGTPTVKINGKAVSDKQLQQLLTESGSFPTVLKQATGS